MQYCKTCLYPETKPDLTFNEEGICSACTAFEARKTIDWDKRAEEFSSLFYNCDRDTYDAIVPVSGGKDSHYQIIKCKEMGLTVLAVNARTDSLTPLGRKNLDNIAKLGVDLIEIETNPYIRRQINKYTLQKIGDISWAEHVTIFTVPAIISEKLNVPYIIWGENPQNEYGGPQENQVAHKLDKRWLQEFGGLNGLRVGEVKHHFEQFDNEFMWYNYPQNVKTKGIFLGQYFPWDGLKNAGIAEKHGFQTHSYPIENSSVNYENLDNFQTGIHDHFKYLKFGFGRCTDIMSNWLRRGYIGRKPAIDYVRMYEREFYFRPLEELTYMQRPFRDILKEIDVNMNEYLRICQNFRNPAIFDGNLKRIENWEYMK